MPASPLARRLLLVGVVGGIWLDRIAGTRALFTLMGTVLGSVAAFWGVYKMILPVLYGAKQQETTRKGRKH